ncbi:MAG: DNA polymerase III subunit chi [Alphaproteobacteria bacterium]|nr:MAG: DNA polymerase III subunit chi [Alphaproteobacteria bacterium]
MITYLLPSCDNTFKYFFDLVYKIYKCNKKALIIFQEEENMHFINENLWKFRNFLPHGLANEAYAQDQPILLTLDKIANFDVHIYFQHTAKEYDNVQNILWNPTPDEAKGKIWKLTNSQWVLKST